MSDTRYAYVVRIAPGEDHEDGPNADLAMRTRHDAVGFAAVLGRESDRKLSLRVEKVDDDMPLAGLSNEPAAVGGDEP